MISRSAADRLRARIPAAWRDLASPAAEYAAAPLVTQLRSRRFVIVCGPRTGSELLRELLDALADVQCEGELLQTWKRWPVAFLNGRAVLGGFGRLAWGCKILDAHLHLGLAGSSPPGEDVLAKLVAEGWTIIHLQRRDLLTQALSFLHAMHGQWHFREPSGFAPFEADPATLIALLCMLDGSARWLEAKLGQVPHTSISYEDDLRTPEGQEATLTRLADLLKVPHRDVSSDLRAVAPVKPEDRVTNLAEVVKALEHTRFASLLHGRTAED